jgi:hypothetical protein
MVEAKYNKYIIKEPIAKGRFAPMIHLCGESHLIGTKVCAGSTFPRFPAEQTLMCITEPRMMKAAPHAHNYDQLLYFLGGNPMNFYDFGAEVEITLGEQDEKYIINSTSIVYIPKGTMHCPINFKRIDNPILFMHLCLAPEYSRSKGEMTGHPNNLEAYTPGEISKLRKGIIKRE